MFKKAFQYIVIVGIGIVVFSGCADNTPNNSRLLQSGPMLGAVEMMEATIWLQTKEPASVGVEYWPVSDSVGNRLHKKGKTTADDFNTTKLTLEELEPGTQYKYRISINNRDIELDYPTTFTTQELWQWRIDPPPFTIAIGSCLYINDPEYDRPGDPYGGQYEILESIHQKNPDLMLWLGDNVYYREVDFYSEAQMAERYRHTRSIEEMQALIAGSVNLAIWDDHDYGPNDSDRTYRMRRQTLNIFKTYWPNPAFGTLETPGIFFRYKYSDVEFFMTDNRFHRAPNKVDNSSDDYLGREQLNWLKESLVSSNATFKLIVVGNQATNIHSKHESFSKYRERYNELMQFLASNKIEGVVFLSGDRHFTELLKTERNGLYPLYEFTSSPLTSGTYSGIVESKEAENPLRVDGTLVYETRNFGMVQVGGERGERTLTLQTYDVEGEKRWEYEINQKDLEF